MLDVFLVRWVQNCCWSLSGCDEAEVFGNTFLWEEMKSAKLFVHWKPCEGLVNNFNTSSRVDT